MLYRGNKGTEGKFLRQHGNKYPPGRPSVYLGNYARTKETVVVKKLRGESGGWKRRFIKEGQMLNDLKGHR